MKFDANCPVCKQTYDIAQSKYMCKGHRYTYHATKCKDCNEIVLSEYNQLCIRCMDSTPLRQARRGKHSLRYHASRRHVKSRSYSKPPFVLDIDGPDAKEDI